MTKVPSAVPSSPLFSIMPKDQIMRTEDARNSAKNKMGDQGVLGMKACMLGGLMQGNGLQRDETWKFKPLKGMGIFVRRS